MRREAELTLELLECCRRPLSNGMPSTFICPFLCFGAVLIWNFNWRLLGLWLGLPLRILELGGCERQDAASSSERNIGAVYKAEGGGGTG